MSTSTTDVAASASDPAVPSFREATKVWARIGLLSFGGPAGQIALMHKELVEDRRWIGEQRFLHALNYCMVLPGPEAQQLATYIGWLMHRTLGGLVAGVLFILPGALVMFGLSVLYVVYRHVPLIDAVFFGVKAAVLAVVVEAVLRIGRRALKNRVMIGIAVAAFLGIYLLRIPFPIIILAAGLVGWLGSRHAPAVFAGGGHGGKSQPADTHGVIDRMFERGQLTHAVPSTRRTIRVVILWLAIWLAPVLLLWLSTGGSSLWTQLGTFFATMGVVTFSGAYAVLTYVAQAAVDSLPAGAGRDGRWPQARRDHAGSTDSGSAVRRFSRRLPGTGHARSAGGGRARRPADHMGGVRAVLSVHLRRRALCRSSTRQPGGVGGVVRHHRRCRRRRHEPCPLVRSSCGFWEVRAFRLFGIGPDLPVLSSIDWRAALLAAAAIVAMLRFKVGMIPTLAVCAAAGVGLQMLPS